MARVLSRAMSLFELLSRHPEGMQISEIVKQLDTTLSGTHRQLEELVELGYVHQEADGKRYAMSMKFAAMGLSYMARCRVSDLIQPVLDRLAHETQELIRLAVVDGDKLLWVAVAQGARGGLRYDPVPEQGMELHLASTAGGRSWLSTLAPDRALEIAQTQGLRRPNAERGTVINESADDLIEELRQTTARGYAIAQDTYHPGVTAIAVPVYSGSGPANVAIGALSIAGPSLRMSIPAIEDHLPHLYEAARDVSQASAASAYFAKTLASAPTAPA